MGAGLGGDEAAVADLRGQLYRFEGVAGGDGPAFAAERVVGVAAEGFADESGDGGGAERFESEGAPARAARQAPQGLGVVREFLRAVGDDEQERQLLGARGERGEPAQGLRVGPVGVVEDEDHGGLLYGEVGEHPVEAVAQALRVGRRAFGGGAEAEGGTHDRVPTAQRGAEVGGGGAREAWLEELARDVEGDALLLVAAACVQDGAALGGGLPAHFGEEAGLAESGGRGDGEQRAVRPVRGSPPPCGSPVSSFNTASTTASSLSRSNSFRLPRPALRTMAHPHPRHGRAPRFPGTSAYAGAPPPERDAAFSVRKSVRFRCGLRLGCGFMSGTVLDHWRGGLDAVPEEVWRHPALEVLLLADNRLAHLSERIGTLTRLHTLDLGHNLLTSVPAELGGLTGLSRFLYLHDNRLTELPESLGALDRLAYLNVGENRLTALHSTLGAMTGLVELRAQHNRLDALPDGIGGLTALRELWLRGNRLSALPASVGDLAELREVELRDNAFAVVPEALRALPRLRRLDLRGNRLREVPGWVAELPCLEKLDLRWNDVRLAPGLLDELTGRGCVVLR